METLATSHNHQTPSPDTIYLLIGRRIRAARLEQGLSLAELGGAELSRSFLSAVERGRTRISLRALTIVAARPKRSVAYFLEDPPIIDKATEVPIDLAEAALAYSDLLHSRGETEQALQYALWAARARLAPPAP